MDVRTDESQVQDGLGGEVMESMGVHDGTHTMDSEEHGHEEAPSTATLAVQKRLKSQKRAHEREVRDLHARIGDLESRMTQPNMTAQQPMINPYGAPQHNGTVDDTIHQAVSLALNHRDMKEREARDAENQQHVAKKLQAFQKHLDGMGDKYDDFHDVVFDRDAKFTPTMRDYASTMPKSGAGSAGEVLYKLGKNPEELERISKLHPHDQASELAALSHGLISVGEAKIPQSSRPMGQIKSSPVTNSRGVTDKTPIGDIRARMKSGGWK